jgi:hypothetical protein
MTTRTFQTAEDIINALREEKMRGFHLGVELSSRLAEAARRWSNAIDAVTAAQAYGRTLSIALSLDNLGVPQEHIVVLIAAVRNKTIYRSLVVTA